MIKTLSLLTLISFGISQSFAQAWQPCNLSVNGNSTFGTSVCVHQGKLYATNNSNGLQVSSDNGTTWSIVNSDITSPGVDLYSTGDRLYAILHNSGCSLIQYSTDNGQTFNLDTTGLPTCYSGAVTMPSSLGISWTNHLLFSLAGPDWEFSRNTNDLAWVDASYFDANDCSEFFVKNDTCWAATNGATSNGLAWSTDGINWTSPVSNNIPEFYVPSQIAFLGNRLFMMGSDVMNGGAGVDTIIKYSDDYGINFQDINIEPYLDGSAVFSPSGKQNTLNMFSGYGKLYLTLSNDVYGSAPELIVSSDNGLSFQKDTVGFPDNITGTTFFINSMAFLNGWVFAQVNSGDLYRKQIASVGINTINRPSFQVFPNPVSSYLKFSELAKGSIFDGLGKEVIAFDWCSTLIVESLIPGSYLLKIENQFGKTFQHKLIIIHE
ncbi:MAG: T9SS type A sorting domain-containing protein [Bacteroidia bacterium]|nr:T9SS type A sorting domain-containing protein [Bacteroidia bacterium]